MQYSIANLSDSNSTHSFRLDAEFFHPELIKYDKALKKKGFNKFRQHIDILTDYTANGSFASLKENSKVKDDVDFAKWIRIQNLDSDNFDNNVRYVSEKSYNFLKKSKLKGGELLISKTGEYLGKAYIFRPSDGNYTLADNIFLLTLKDRSLNNFLYAYINSKLGRKLLLRWNQGTGQPTILKDSLRELQIPIISEVLVRSVTKLVNMNFALIKLEKELFKEAENTLLKQLDLGSWKPQRKLSYIKNFSKAVEANRIDAEYFQPQYDDIISHVKAHNNMPLSDIVDYSKGIEVGSEEYIDEGVDFVRVSDFSVRGFEIAEKKISHELVVKLQGKYSSKKGDILFTKDGTIGITWVNDEDNKAVLSGAFLILKPKIEIDREYLALVLNSIICSKQIEMLSGGALIAHLKPSDAMSLQIPILSKVLQKEISGKILESKATYRKSKALLEIAKKAVELAIEESEDKASKWIDEECKKLEIKL